LPSIERILSPYLQPGLVGGRSLVGLRDANVVVLLADERPDASVLARGEQFEILHPLLGDILRVGVQVADHAGGGPLHQAVGVHGVDVVERQFAHHVDGDLHVAAQPEVVAGANVRSPAAPTAAAAVSR